MDPEEFNRDLAPTPELSAILAHEIKNPMNSIIINMEVLRSSIQEMTGGGSTPAALRATKYLDVIEGEIRRLDKVIRGFLDLNSPPQTNQSDFSLNQTVQTIVEFLDHELKQKNVVVEVDLVPSLPSIHGNADQIKQALLNLIINAMQALPEGGSIRIKTRFENDWIIIQIQDSGIGIDSRLFNKIFNPYFTTKAKGSGLGLTIVRRVVKEHGGEIHLESALGQGTSFTLKFPKRPAVGNSNDEKGKEKWQKPLP